MTALLSILALIGAWAALVSLDPIRWPWQREEPLYDVQYWQAVKRDTAAYLETHSTVNASIRRNVEAMGQVAQQRLEGLAQ